MRAAAKVVAAQADVGVGKSRQPKWVSMYTDLFQSPMRKRASPLIKHEKTIPHRSKCPLGWLLPTHWDVIDLNVFEPSTFAIVGSHF